MKDEVSSAANFLVEKLKERAEVGDEHGERFRVILEELMCTRFQNHWHPDKPLKGNAFRCLNINLEECCLDPLLKEAAAESSIDVEELTACFPDGLALWVDPCDVSYRLGRGSICPVYRKYNPNKSQSNRSERKTTQGQLVYNNKIGGWSKMDRSKLSPQPDSQLNSQAPVFTPRVGQNQSSNWKKKWQYNNNTYSLNYQQNTDDYYSYFQRDPDQNKYNRFHWHKDENQSKDRKPLTGFEFRNFAQEVY